MKDEIPLFDRAGWKQPDEYLYLWDSSLEFYPRDGKMTYEPMTENFKTGVKNMIKWYQEGIIDPEIFTRGASARDTLLSGDLGGCTHDWVSASNYNTTLSKTIPGFEMTAIAPVADQHGAVKERVSRYPGAGWGIEGQTFTRKEDGSKEFTDEVLNSELTPIGYLRAMGVQYRIGMCQDGQYEYATMTEAGKKANELYNSHMEWFDDSLPPYADGKLDLKYAPEDESKYKTIMASIKPYVEEKFQSWILGVSDFDADYDAFLEELKARGIEEAIEINQRAYETYLTNSTK